MQNQKLFQEIVGQFECMRFAQQVYEAIATAVAKKHGTLRHLRRIIDEPVLADQLAELVIPLFEKEVQVNVDLDTLPGFDEVEKHFSRHGVQQDFFLEGEWEEHSSLNSVHVSISDGRVRVAATAPTITIGVKQFRRDISTAEAIEEMARHHCRPARPLEAYLFSRQYPKVQLTGPILALGAKFKPRNRSFALVVCLHTRPDRRRTFEGKPSDQLWGPRCRFLFVRQSKLRGVGVDHP